MTLQVSCGEDLKKLRKASGLTQKEVAQRASLSQSLIARIEAGKIDPRLSTLKKILGAITTSKGEKTASKIMKTPIIFVKTTESIRRAVDLMEEKGISQLPVLDGERLVGSVQEGTVIAKILKSKNPDKLFNLRVREVMEDPFPTVSPNAKVDDVLSMFAHEKPAVLVMDRGRFLGIITKIDVITAIRSE